MGLVRRSVYTVKIVWTPSHVDAVDVDVVSNPVYVYLNNGADGLDKAGARTRMPPFGIVRGALARVQTSRQIQATLTVQISLRQLAPP